MITHALLAFLVVGQAVAVFSCFRLARRPRSSEPELELVRLLLKGDAPSVDGLLAGRAGGCYLIRDAVIVYSEDQSLATGSSLEVPERNVLAVQRRLVGELPALLQPSYLGGAS